MPYIKKEKRHVLDPHINAVHHALVELGLDDPDNNMEGNINYVIMRLLKLVYGEKTHSYRDVNSVVGLLNCVIHEYYRESAAPYEDGKRVENGSVEGTLVPVLLNETVVRKDGSALKNNE